MIPAFRVIDGPDEVRGELQDGVVVEVGGQPLLRQFDAVALDAREADFERIALGADGLDLDGLARRLRRRDDRLGREVEGNAEDVGVLDVEQAFFVQVVGLAAQRAADDLLAQKLGAEGADAEDVGDGVGVPALGEHGDRDDAADRLRRAGPCLPTVFMTSRSSSWSVMFSPARRSPVRSTISRRKRSISSAAMPRKLSSSASPDSSCSLSISSVFGRGERIAVLVEVAEQRQPAVLQRGRCHPRSRGGSRR